MADSHEERLLNDLLGQVAREDARLDAAHLEARVLEAAVLYDTPRASRGAPGYWMAGGIAAALALAIGGAVAWWPVEPADRAADPSEPQIRIHHVEPPTIFASEPESTAPSPAEVRGTRPHARAAVAVGRRTPSPAREAPAVTGLAQAAAPPLEFVPLVPLTERDLAGPFQIVRVQMPSASLGPLQSPYHHPGELVAAEVLLGEDGMARAIRVSTDGSVFPWRSR